MRRYELLLELRRGQFIARCELLRGGLPEDGRGLDDSIARLRSWSHAVRRADHQGTQEGVARKRHLALQRLVSNEAPTMLRTLRWRELICPLKPQECHPESSNALQIVIVVVWGAAHGGRRRDLQRLLERSEVNRTTQSAHGGVPSESRDLLGTVIT